MAHKVATGSSADLADRLICATLRGEDPPWPEAGGAEFVEAFLRRSNYQGMLAMLNERLHQSESWPAQIRGAIHSHVVVRAIWELQHQKVLTQVLSAFAQIGLQPVLFKGTALAYSLYPRPILRSRGDTDMMIPSTERKRAHEILSSLGFELSVAGGNFVSYQGCYTFTHHNIGRHTIDLHWRINNSELLSRLFSYDELLKHSMLLPSLCPHAIRVNPVHALLIACMHRATHLQNPYYAEGIAYYSADRLNWLYDIHLLCTTSTTAQWEAFVRLAKEKGLCATCFEGIQRAGMHFKTSCPSFVLNGLSSSDAKERTVAYLNGNKLRQQWMDFCELDGMTNKVCFLRELVFPSAAYMHTKYPNVHRGWLPILYVHRALVGVMKRVGVTRETV